MNVFAYTFDLNTLKCYVCRRELRKMRFGFGLKGLEGRDWVEEKKGEKIIFNDSCFFFGV